VYLYNKCLKNPHIIIKYTSVNPAHISTTLSVKAWYVLRICGLYICICLQIYAGFRDVCFTDICWACRYVFHRRMRVLQVDVTHGAHLALALRRAALGRLDALRRVHRRLRGACKDIDERGEGRWEKREKRGERGERGERRAEGGERADRKFSGRTGRCDASAEEREREEKMTRRQKQRRRRRRRERSTDRQIDRSTDRQIDRSTDKKWNI
jgi:hypothetical protein